MKTHIIKQKYERYAFDFNSLHKGNIVKIKVDNEATFIGEIDGISATQIRVINPTTNQYATMSVDYFINDLNTDIEVIANDSSYWDTVR